MPNLFVKDCRIYTWHQICCSQSHSVMGKHADCRKLHAASAAACSSENAAPHACLLFLTRLHTDCDWNDHPMQKTRETNPSGQRGLRNRCLISQFGGPRGLPVVTLCHVTKSAMARGATWLVGWEAGPAAQFGYTSVFSDFSGFLLVWLHVEKSSGRRNLFWFFPNTIFSK